MTTKEELEKEAEDNKPPYAWCATSFTENNRF